MFGVIVEVYVQKHKTTILKLAQQNDRAEAYDLILRNVRVKNAHYFLPYILENKVKQHIKVIINELTKMVRFDL